jgi:hypothetical protein
MCYGANIFDETESHVVNEGQFKIVYLEWPDNGLMESRSMVEWLNLTQIHANVTNFLHSFGLRSRGRR